MSLFIKKNLTLHSGLKSDFKIDADGLTDEDIETIAYLISKKYQFKSVFGVPTGGLLLANMLDKFKINDDSLPTLIVDDVLTTGGSMEKFRKQIDGNTIGVVIFARGKCPEWISPLFQMWDC